MLGFAFGVDFLSAGRADTGISGHLDGPHGPINLWVVFFQLGESKCKLLLPNTGDCKYCLFVMSIIPEYQLHHLSDQSFFIQSSIYIIDWDGLS